MSTRLLGIPRSCVLILGFEFEASFSLCFLQDIHLLCPFVSLLQTSADPLHSTPFVSVASYFNSFNHSISFNPSPCGTYHIHTMVRDGKQKSGGAMINRHVFSLGLDFSFGAIKGHKCTQEKSRSGYNSLLSFIPPHKNIIPITSVKKTKTKGENAQTPVPWRV